MSRAKKIKSLRDLVQDDRNANLGTERGGEMVAFSLKKFGAGRSVLVDRKGKLIAGNKTVQNAPAAGVEGIIVAPLLRHKIGAHDIAQTRHGALVFHPSLLPRHRGPDAIKAAFRAGEKYTGATWFWANGRFDAGDICEQEVLEIVPGERPREFYERAVIPSALKLLRHALDDLSRGHVRRRPQREEAATYEGGVT